MEETTCRKAGREAYTILDKPFFYGLGRVSSALENAEVKHALYGGCGLQAHFAAKIARSKSINRFPKLRGYVRPTSDYDFAVEKKVRKAQIEAALSIVSNL